MQKIRIKDLIPGMVLASHALDLNGRLLLKGGEEITDKDIRTFKAWGMTEVDIEDTICEHGISKGQSSAISTEQVPTKVKEEVDELFRYSNKKHPAIKELVELCILRKMEFH